jgi:hypothetical protein
MSSRMSATDAATSARSWASMKAAGKSAILHIFLGLAPKKP